MACQENASHATNPTVPAALRGALPCQALRRRWLEAERGGRRTPATCTKPITTGLGRVAVPAAERRAEGTPALNSFIRRSSTLQPHCGAVGMLGSVPTLQGHPTAELGSRSPSP